MGRSDDFKEHHSGLKSPDERLRDMMGVLSKVRTRAMAAVYPAIFRTDDHQEEIVRLGSDYGGWWVPKGLLGPDSVCYCGGVGMDISFDLALISTFGCKVYGIDPTPKSIDWVESQQDLDPRFNLIPVGLGASAGTENFYAPSDPEHVSHSVKNLQRTTTYFPARVQTVSGLMQELGHERIDLLKLDIEGAEHDTIRSMLSDGLRPKVLCVEYDQPEPLSWARRTTASLRAAGYSLVKVDLFNLTFIYKPGRLD